MEAGELEAFLRAHPYLQVERPPLLWGPVTELEPFVRLLGELIAAALVRNGGELGQVTLNISNVTVDPATAAGSAIPAGDFVALTIRSRGDWSPEVTWRPLPHPAPTLLNEDVTAASGAAGAACGYTYARRRGGLGDPLLRPRAAGLKATPR